MTITETKTTLDVTPLSGTIGAVIRGADLRQLDEATTDEIRQIWLPPQRRLSGGIINTTNLSVKPDQVHCLEITSKGRQTSGSRVVTFRSFSINLFSVMGVAFPMKNGGARHARWSANQAVFVF